MTANQFRRQALRLPEAEESSHMGHPDFRVRGKVFASLGYPEEGWGMVKLSPAQQQRVVRGHPDVFAPVTGAWGRQGATVVRLQAAHPTAVRDVLGAAWRHAAPRALAVTVRGAKPTER
jgi:hypothetical protein